jgi:hypothetical protein
MSLLLLLLHELQMVERCGDIVGWICIATFAFVDFDRSGALEFQTTTR